MDECCAYRGHSATVSIITQPPQTGRNRVHCAYFQLNKMTQRRPKGPGLVDACIFSQQCPIGPGLVDDAHIFSCVLVLAEFRGGVRADRRSSWVWKHCHHRRPFPACVAEGWPDEAWELLRDWLQRSVVLKVGMRVHAAWVHCLEFLCGDLISALYPLFLMKSYCERATERNKEKIKRKKHPQIKVKENRMKQIRNPTEQKLICWNMLRMEALDAPFNGHCWKIVILWRANSFCDKYLFGNFFMLKSMFCCWFCFVHDKKCIYILKIIF